MDDVHAAYNQAARRLNSKCARDAVAAEACDFRPTRLLARLLAGLLARLLGRDAAGRFGKSLDALLDVLERFQAGFDGRRGDILQNLGCDRIAQTVEIIDKLAAARREKQAVGTAIPEIGSAFQQAVLDQTVEQTHQRDRLQFKHVGQIDLRQSLLLPQSKQHNPLRARGATALGTVVDVVAQQTRAFDQLRNQPAFQIELQWA